ncbi:MAG: membrane protein [Armatimonadaceae bacterium]
MGISANDIASIGTLVLLEGLLSADNALVLALLARKLPDKAQQSKALTLGISLSFLFRAVGLLLAKIIIQFWFMRAAGAAYLLYLAGTHFFSRSGHGSEDTDAETDGAVATPAEAKRAFGKVVVALALTDLAFAIDSILVAVAITDTLWVIYVGVALGIIALRLVADAFLRLLERYPALEHTAYALVAWAGLKLGLEAVQAFGETVMHRTWHLEMPGSIFWVGMAAITVLGTLFALRRPAQYQVTEVAMPDTAASDELSGETPAHARNGAEAHEPEMSDLHPATHKAQTESAEAG